MMLETRECIALYIFLKKREGELSGELENIMHRCEVIAYDNLSALDLEKFLDSREGGIE